MSRVLEVKTCAMHVGSGSSWSRHQLIGQASALYQCEVGESENYLPR